MGMTLAEKLLARAAGEKNVVAGSTLFTQVDALFSHELGVRAWSLFEQVGSRIFDPERVYMVVDHDVPSNDLTSAESAKALREYTRKYGVKHFFDMGRGGVMHVVLTEEGLLLPGELVVGGDSHSCTAGALGCFATGMGIFDIAGALATGKVWLKVPSTVRILYSGKLNPWVCGKDLILYTLKVLGKQAMYRSLELAGPAVEQLSMDDRFTMCNMVVEAGAKNALFYPDEVTQEYLSGRARREYSPLYPDPEALYEATLKIDCSEIEPQVALPHFPANAVQVREAAGVELNQVVIGSCTNGRLSDLAVAAEILKGRQVHPRTRLLIFPGSQKILIEAMSRGYIQTFLNAGAILGTPSCGPCLGAHMGILAAGEVALTTTNRNFVGRMGDPTSRVYLASPATAAFSAVQGKISPPS